MQDIYPPWSACDPATAHTRNMEYYLTSTPHAPQHYAYTQQTQQTRGVQTYSTHWDYLHCRGDVYGRNVGSE